MTVTDRATLAYLNRKKQAQETVLESIRQEIAAAKWNDAHLYAAWVDALCGIAERIDKTTAEIVKREGQHSE